MNLVFRIDNSHRMHFWHSNHKCKTMKAGIELAKRMKFLNTQKICIDSQEDCIDLHSRQGTFVQILRHRYVRYILRYWNYYIQVMQDSLRLKNVGWTISGTVNNLTTSLNSLKILNFSYECDLISYFPIVWHSSHHNLTHTTQPNFLRCLHHTSYPMMHGYMEK